MPKHTRNANPMDRPAFDAAMGRIKELTGAKTQCQLAEVLDVRQSSISDAKRRASIPAEWVLKLHRSHRAMQDWILDGTGPRTLDDLIPAEVRETAQAVREVRAELGHMADMLREHLAMARMTADDLEIRKLAAQSMLEACCGRTDLLLASLNGKAQAMPEAPAQPAQ